MQQRANMPRRVNPAVRFSRRRSSGCILRPRLGTAQRVDFFQRHRGVGAHYLRNHQTRQPGRRRVKVDRLCGFWRNKTKGRTVPIGLFPMLKPDPTSSLALDEYPETPQPGRVRECCGKKWKSHTISCTCRVMILGRCRNLPTPLVLTAIDKYLSLPSGPPRQVNENGCSQNEGGSRWPDFQTWC